MLFYSRMLTFRVRNDALLNVQYSNKSHIMLSYLPPRYTVNTETFPGCMYMYADTTGQKI